MTLKTTRLEAERELPEDRYTMTVKRRQSLREHPRVTGDRADARITEDRVTMDARALSIPVEPRIMTSAARAELRAVSPPVKTVITAPYKGSTKQAVKALVPPDRFPPPKYPYSRVKKKPKEETKEGKSKKKKGSEKPGTIHWRQGLWWISLEPRGKDKYVKIYSKAPPPGAPAKKRTPEETFFVKGGSENVPADLRAKLGFMNVDITPTGVPKIGFSTKRRRRRR